MSKIHRREFAHNEPKEFEFFPPEYWVSTSVAIVPTKKELRWKVGMMSVMMLAILQLAFNHHWVCLSMYFVVCACYLKYWKVKNLRVLDKEFGCDRMEI